jgi:hypothetical protein
MAIRNTYSNTVGRNIDILRGTIVLYGKRYIVRITGEIKLNISV